MVEKIEKIKSIFLGKPLESRKEESELLSKKLALPIFASDALSSCAYAPDQLLLTLSLAGLAGITISWEIGLMIAVVFITVVLSYTQTVHAYPSGGGDFEVVQKNLPGQLSLIVGSALMVDYILTITVSVSSAIEHLGSQLQFIENNEVQICIISLIILTTINLRGTRESGKFFAIPVYLFISLIFLMAIIGIIRISTHSINFASTASLTIKPEAGYVKGLTGFVGFFLILRAFASGCAALTGVEAISNGVPTFKKPKSKNAAMTLIILGIIAVFMMLSIIFLARELGVKYVDNPHIQLLQNGLPVPKSFVQIPVIEQISRSVFDFAPFIEVILSITTTIILLFAANTAFGGFPVLTSILSKNQLLPKQLSRRGDKLSYSNGIIVLSILAALLITLMKADVTKIIQLYIVGVFISFTLSQTGMVIHWTKLLKLKSISENKKRKMKISRCINIFGLCLTSIVLMIIMSTKFLRGAWITLCAIMILYLLMTTIRHHYKKVEKEVKLSDKFASNSRVLPSRVHAIVLVSELNKPAMRALAYARTTNPSFFEIVSVGISNDDYSNIVEQWNNINIDVPLRVLATPYRGITKPVIDYVQSIKKKSPRDLIAMYIPEYVTQKWSEQFLHNQSALRIKTRLHFMTNVIVASVPWQLNTLEQKKIFTKK